MDVQIVDFATKKVLETFKLRAGKTYSIPKGYAISSRIINKNLEIVYVVKE
jgi:hypothetical protein